MLKRTIGIVVASMAMLTVHAQKNIPLVYGAENTGKNFKAPAMPGESRPVNGVEADDLLADEVHVGRPITLVILAVLVQVAQRGQVAEQGVQAPGSQRGVGGDCVQRFRTWMRYLSVSVICITRDGARGEASAIAMAT